MTEVYEARAGNQLMKRIEAENVATKLFDRIKEGSTVCCRIIAESSSDEVQNAMFAAVLVQDAQCLSILISTKAEYDDAFVL